MQKLDAMNLPAWAKRYPLAGGRVRRLKLAHRVTGPTLEVVVSRPDGPRLRLRLVGVEEFRFQKRPTQPAGRVRAARFGYFGGLFFLDLDAYALSPGDKVAAHDFRASDSYAAGAELWWEEVPVPPVS